MAEATFSFDLHVLSTPPAFNLSQNQTLQFKSVSNPCGKAAEMNLKVLFPFAIHLSMNQNLPPFQAASGFMPFSSSTVKNFFSFRDFFRGRISFLPSRRKVPYRLFDFHLSSNFLNFFWKLSKLPSRLPLSLAPNELARCVFNWREGGFYACGMGLSTNFCIFDKFFSHGTETHQSTL